MREYIFILSIAALLAFGCCQKEEPARVQLYTCDDGSKVIDKGQCAAQPEPSMTGASEPELVEVAKSGIAVSSADKAKEAFADYASDKGFSNYTIVFTEKVTLEDIEYYRIKYSYDQRNSFVLVDSSGAVYQEFYKI